MEYDVPTGAPAAAPTPAAGDPRLSRLSLNQKTVDRLDLPAAVDLCARHGIPAIGLWREPVTAYGVRRSAKLVRDAGLRVSSLCRGGFLTAEDLPLFRAAIHANQRAILEAAELGTDTLVMVVGGLPAGSRDLAGARERVADAIAELAPFAASQGVRLALEPMHPMFCADRGVLSTVDEAVAMAAPHPVESVGVVVDTYHVWWDPTVAAAIAAAGDRIASFQVCDWVVPLPADTLLGRGMMGDGHIDFRALRGMVDDAGYSGDIEVEIFNADVWAADADETAATVKRRYTSEVL
ncbi:3-dehydroshikimate dehydratase [Actinocatenispora thailandica]|uniref:3-dehydroshikimate dehydratase n=1 Tax=Actinocatenispora thailandica TaxID=227318 RepID=A0A7R7DWI0_9ACTN|nr:sugar phosphate isomerase/epimerase family protein [Actinocatenispora thailandica]BCJ39165.1 3-dehydroshikimate dehydratase [Actinocatenispora thailandica]